MRKEVAIEGEFWFMGIAGLGERERMRVSE